jgi:ABC-2 type transport system ATP-binding protein
MSVYLSVDQISKKYKTTQAVDRLSFQVERGKIFAFLGPNGAGKSTSVRMLLGLIRPDSGSIRFHDLADGQRPSPNAMGYLPEERGLYLDRSVLDNLVYLGRLRGMDKQAAKDKASVWLKRFDLLERQDEKVSALSKGNQQKVQLIAAILHDPEVAILDEPFSGLDPINQEKMLEILRELKARGTTILLSAHQMALVERLADDLLLMSHGRSVLQGPVADILAQHRTGDEQPDLHDIYIAAVRAAGESFTDLPANGEADHA